LLLILSTGSERRGPLVFGAGRAWSLGAQRDAELVDSVERRTVEVPGRIETTGHLAIPTACFDRFI
jgi:hypothetical protein